MSAFHQRFQGKIQIMPKNGLVNSKDVHKSMEIMKIEDQKQSKSIQKSVRQLQEQKVPKLPPLPKKYIEKTSMFFNKPSGVISTKKIYSADQSKQAINRYDSDVESLQRKHLQYLNKIEQLYLYKS